MCVCVSVKLLVHAFCGVHIFLTQRWIGLTCGMLMRYNVGNKMRMSMLGSKVIKGVLLDETLRWISIFKFVRDVSIMESL